jgi:hypothetical protein
MANGVIDLLEVNECNSDFETSDTNPFLYAARKGNIGACRFRNSSTNTGKRRMKNFCDWHATESN